MLGPIPRNSDFVGLGKILGIDQDILLSPGGSNILQGLSPSARPASYFTFISTLAALCGPAWLLAYLTLAGPLDSQMHSQMGCTDT